MDFLDNIPLGVGQVLSTSDRKKLADLGLESPQELFGVIQATPQAFSQLLGVEKTRLLEKSLRELLTKSQGSSQALVMKRRPTRFATGAVISGRKPKLKAPRYDIQERDRLFEELQTLRALPKTKENCNRINQLESQLNILLDGVA